MLKTNRNQDLILFYEFLSINNASFRNFLSDLYFSDQTYFLFILFYSEDL